MSANNQTLLPSHGVPMMIPEIFSAGFDVDGKSVRIVGRVDHYDAAKAIALLSQPSSSDASMPCTKLTVDTSLTNASDYRIGSQVMIIGELAKCEVGESAGHIMLKARVLRYVDGLDYTLYCKSVNVWRIYDSIEG